MLCFVLSGKMQVFCLGAKFCTACFLYYLLHVSQTPIAALTMPDGLVTPMKFTAMVEREGKDWNSARAVCDSVDMTLATIDLYSFAFLFSSRFRRHFQKDRHFWIGLYDENTRNQTSSMGEYRWSDRCQAVQHLFWGQGFLGDSAGEFCVYAANTDLRWRTDKCSAKHQYLCQRREQMCRYNQTLPSCTLYITATKRDTIRNISVPHCLHKCENTQIDSLPCWGFTMTSSGCVLHYQATQPNCDITHHPSDYYFRTCFQLFFVNSSQFNVPSDTQHDLPVVPQCDSNVIPLRSRLKTLVTTTTEQTKTSREGSTTTDLMTSMLTQSTANTTSTKQPSTMFKTDPLIFITKFSRKQDPFLCACKCDVRRRNVTQVLERMEVTKADLSLDVKALSAKRRTKCSALDVRGSSRGMAIIGVCFVALTLSFIVVPDLASLLYHLRHGVPTTQRKARRRPCHIP
uniref:C-type lectin n=1 Tax=Littorina littorea TaxID=31216 RepID=A0A0A7RRK6_LITLI|nr:C-type lectin [Littorina littorea]